MSGVLRTYIHSKQSGNNMDEKMGTTGQQNTKEIHTHCTVCPKSREERNWGSVDWPFLCTLYVTGT